MKMLKRLKHLKGNWPECSMGSLAIIQSTMLATSPMPAASKITRGLVKAYYASPNGLVKINDLYLQKKLLSIQITSWYDYLYA
jgi:hypothetical protein